MSKTFDYKILKIKNIRKEINALFLSKPYQFVSTEINQFGWKSSKWFVKVKDISSSKIFLILFDEMIFNQLKNYYMSLSSSEDMYKTVFCFKPTKLISFKIDQTTKNSCESIVGFEQLFHTLQCQNPNGLDENIFTPYLIDESWLDQPVIYGSICTKCSRDYPWVPQDPGYVCYGCKIGY